MNNPYEMDIFLENYKKRKYDELESIIRKKITYKKYKFSKKRTCNLEDTLYIFSRVKL